VGRRIEVLGREGTVWDCGSGWREWHGGEAANSAATAQGLGGCSRSLVGRRIRLLSAAAAAAEGQQEGGGQAAAAAVPAREGEVLQARSLHSPDPTPHADASHRRQPHAPQPARVVLTDDVGSVAG